MKKKIISGLLAIILNTTICCKVSDIPKKKHIYSAMDQNVSELSKYNFYSNFNKRLIEDIYCTGDLYIIKHWENNDWPYGKEVTRIGYNCNGKIKILR